MAAQAACEALAADLATRTPRAVDARAIVVRRALASDVRPRRIAAELDLTDRSVRSLRHRVVTRELESAVDAQIALRLQLRGAPAVLANDSERRSIQRSRVLHGDASFR